MDFDLTEDQQLLSETLARLLADHYDFEHRNSYLASADGWSREQWHRYADMGLLGLPFAEADGGLGGGAIETMMVMEAFGRALVLEPFFATVLLSGGLLQECASAEQRAALIPPIIAGERLLAFAQAENHSRYDLNDVDTRARRVGGGWIIDGHKRQVLHGDCADQLLVSARLAGERRDRSGIGLFLVDAGARGLKRRGYVMQDRTRAADLELVGVEVAAGAALNDEGTALPAIERVVDRALAALCAEAVGAMSRAQEITVEYLKVRRQFGTVLGSFQALQHRAVDMLVLTEQARSMAMYAAMMCQDPNPAERSRAMAAAKVQIGKSGKFVSEQAIQLHGGIGVTEECQVGHYYRRLSMIELLFGDRHFHLSALARSGGLEQ
ncbi:MAG: acyl-CoA dehydrogenase family protein [Steroidobacteraceae bacterium]